MQSYNNHATFCAPCSIIFLTSPIVGVYWAYSLKGVSWPFTK